MAFNDISQFSGAFLKLAQVSSVLLPPQPLLLFLLVPAFRPENPGCLSRGRRLELKQDKPRALSIAGLRQRSWKSSREALNPHPRGQTSRPKEAHESCSLRCWNATPCSVFHFWDVLL